MMKSGRSVLQVLSRRADPASLSVPKRSFFVGPTFLRQAAELPSRYSLRFNPRNAAMRARYAAAKSQPAWRDTVNLRPTGCSECPTCPKVAEGKFCPQCGQFSPVNPPPLTECPQCSAPIEEHYNFCGSCGTDMRVARALHIQNYVPPQPASNSESPAAKRAEECSIHRPEPSRVACQEGRTFAFARPQESRNVEGVSEQGAPRGVASPVPTETQSAASPLKRAHTLYLCGIPEPVMNSLKEAFGSSMKSTATYRINDLPEDVRVLISSPAAAINASTGQDPRVTAISFDEGTPSDLIAALESHFDAATAEGALEWTKKFTHMSTGLPSVFTIQGGQMSTGRVCAAVVKVA